MDGSTVRISTSYICKPEHKKNHLGQKPSFFRVRVGPMVFMINGMTLKVENRMDQARPDQTSQSAHTHTHKLHT